MQVVRLEPMTVVGIVVEARFDELGTLVPQAWKRLWEEADAIRGGLGDRFVEVSEHLGDGRYREVLGLRVDGSADAPEGMVRVELPAASYVHSVHTGPLEGIAIRFGEMQDHARSLGHEPDGVLLDEGYTPDGDRPHDLYVRISTGTA